MTEKKPHIENMKLSAYGSTAIIAALNAGETLLPDFGKGAISHKTGVSNVVTAGDLKSDEVIKNIILDRFPRHTIYSEESKNEITNPLLLDHCWIVDPLDGSKNYADGLDEIYVSIAYVRNGQLMVGVCYNPLKQQLFFAEKGKGAFYRGLPLKVEKPGQFVYEKLAVSQTQALAGASVETSIAYNPNQTIQHQLIKLALYKLGHTARFREIGSSVGQLCRVARGQSDLHFHADLKPWDLAAGKLLIEEAGGVMTGMHGEEITVMSPHSVAGNPDLVRQFVSVVNRLETDSVFRESLIKDITNHIQDFKI